VNAAAVTCRVGALKQPRDEAAMARPTARPTARRVPMLGFDERAKEGPRRAATVPVA